MADVGLWVKNANIQARAGVNANATSKAVAATDVYVLDVEDFICATCKVKITGAIYTALDVSTRYLLMDVGACICAQYVIMSDMSGFTSLAEAQTMLDFLENRANKGLELLKDRTTAQFVGLV